MSKDKLIKIKLVKSGIGRMEKHKLCIKGLGFKKLNQTVKVVDTPSNRGMINKISDMLEILEN
ncbi:MAG: 50S ribosomal protein L30 [Gammaproteobacteria bacterium]|nr:50S ribosomal protein L30 [Gammaproteobacteria bacterium]